MLAKKSTNLRIDAELLDAIDRRAGEVGLSRNEWIERCTRWAIHNLPFKASGPVRTKAARNAPDEVAGTYAEDMGLDGPDGK